MTEVRTITKEEWLTAKRNGYTSKGTGPRGYRMILSNDKKTGGTILEEVHVDGMRSAACH